MDAPFNLPEDLRPAEWTAKWIWDAPFPRSINEATEILYFRRAFEAPAGARLTVRVSADSRYQLFLNGRRVSVGPCKGDGWRKHFETADLTPHLLPGRNVLAAKVIHFVAAEPPRYGDLGPTHIWRAASGAFLLQGAIEGGETLDTDGRWKVLRDEGTGFHRNRGAELVGDGETVDGSRLPHGWEQPGYDDSGWKPAVEVDRALSPYRQMNYEFFGAWSLEPRPIPPLFEAAPRTMRVVQASDGALAAAISGEGEPAVLAPGSEHWVDLDAGELETAYVRLRVSGGAGSQVRLTYAEGYGQGEEDAAWVRKKLRDDPTNGGIYGNHDDYTAGGGDEAYEPFWYRAFRFIRVRVRVGDAPLIVHPLTFVETGYPLEEKASFACSEPDYGRLWDISVRTVRRCMQDTFVDCPYYEQLQYAMDTRLEALFATRVSGDGRMLLKAVHDFHCGWHPSGLVQSRFPCVYPQIIPGFALHWILMVHDHWMLFGDPAVPRRYRSTVDSVLDWFDRRLTPEGIVGGFHYWPYFDWVEGWGGGMPPGAPEKPATVFSQLYAVALKAAADLADATGRSSLADEYRGRAAAVNAAVNSTCWDEAKGLYRDGPETPSFSQHAQAWAILAGCATGERARSLAKACLENASLPKMNWAMQFYLFRALREAGMYNRAYELWPQWQALADLNVTTWPEDPVNQRSDCHGWGSVPLSEFIGETLGVQPAKPGFAAARIEPQPGPLTWARGEAPTPRGPVAVAWRREGGRFLLEAEGPADVPLILILPDGTRREGTGAVSAEGADR
jgi:hypothetical protein